MRLADLEQFLEELERQGLLRQPEDDPIRPRLAAQAGSNFLDLSSNDYLNLRQFQGETSPGSEPELTGPLLESPGSTSLGGHVSRETVPSHGAPASRRLADDVSRETPPPAGAGASRLIFGTHHWHLRIERLVADWLGQPAALLFSTGYAANVGALGCLLSPEDVVVSDALNHASLIDGIRLSRARPVIVPHLDLSAIERALSEASRAAARWVVLESYYSMDGDGPDLGRVRELCDAYDAQLYLDEAHAIGVFGEAGAGLAGAAGIRPDVHMVAFGKAVGSQGACIAGSVPLRTFLWNRARSFVFSTAPAPFLCASLATQLDLTRRADGRRQALHAIAALFRARAHQAGIPVLPHSFGPICVAVVGTPEAALTAAETLRDQGILVQAIRPPTVRSGQCRLRVTLHAGLGEDDVERAVAALAAALNDPLTDRTRA